MPYAESLRDGIKSTLAHKLRSLLTTHGFVVDSGNPSTIIRFHLTKPAHTKLTIIDLAGESVRALLEGDMPAGRHAIPWDGRNDAGFLITFNVL